MGLKNRLITWSRLSNYKLKYTNTIKQILILKKWKHQNYI